MKKIILLCTLFFLCFLNVKASETLLETVLEKETLQEHPILNSIFDETKENSGLYVTNNTDDGKNVYYYRGVNVNNYVSFAGYTWRIINITEDGIAKLMLDGYIIDDNQTFYNYSDTDKTKLYYSQSFVKDVVNNWYNNNINKKGYSGYVKYSNFCEASKFNYVSALKTDIKDYEVTLKCIKDENNYRYYSSNVGLLTLDEAIYSGAYRVSDDGMEYDMFTKSDKSYWLMTPYYNSNKTNTTVFSLYSYGQIGAFYKNTKYGALRPVINIVPNATLLSGDGTINSPFIFNNYSLNKIIDSEGGSASIDKYNAFTGEVINISVNTNTGYKYLKTIVTDSNENTIEVNNNSFIMPDSNTTITPIFEKEKYVVTVENDNEKGEVSINDLNPSYNDEVVLNIKTKPGYDIKNIYFNDKAINLSSNSYTYNKIEENLQLVANGIYKFRINKNINIRVEYKNMLYFLRQSIVDEYTTVLSFKEGSFNFNSSALGDEDINIKVNSFSGYTIKSINYKIGTSNEVIKVPVEYKVGSNYNVSFKMPYNNITFVSYDFEKTKYIITTNIENDNYGTFEIVNYNADNGYYVEDVVNYKIAANNGYMIEKLEMKYGGNSLNFSNNTFIMPASNVVINVKFKEINDDDFNITIEKSDKGNISVEKNNYKYQEKVKINFEDNLFYVLDNIDVYDKYGVKLMTVSDSFDMPNIDIKLVANYSPKYYLIENEYDKAAINVEIENESIANENVSIKYTIKDEGYSIDKILLKNQDNELISELDIYNPMFNMPTQNVKVEFVLKKNNYSISVFESSNGNVSVIKNNALYKDIVYLDINPNKGYELDSLLVKNISNNENVLINDNSFIMPASNVEITSTFKLRNNTISIKEEDGININVSKSSGVINDQVSFDYDIEEGYELIYIKVFNSNRDELEVTNNTFIIDGNDIEIEAKTKLIDYDIEVEENEFISDVITSSANKNEKVNLDIVYMPGYELDYLEVRDIHGNVIESNDNSFVMPNSKVKIKVFTKLKKYNITLNDSSHGSYTISNDIDYTINNVLTIYPKPNEGYELDNIIIYDSKNNPIEVTDNKFTMVPSDLNIYVNYKYIYYDVLVNNSIGGTLNVSKDKAHIGEEINLEYIPSFNYKIVKLFVNGKELDPNVTSFELSAEKTIITPVWEHITMKDVEVNPTISSTHNSITLSYDIDIADKYIIYRSLDNKKYDKIIETSNNTYTDSNLITGITYYYNIIAYREENGELIYSKDYIVKRKVSLEKPALLVKIKHDNITLYYSKIDGANGYEIYYSTDNKKFNKLTTINNGKTTSYKHSKLITNKKYYYKIRSYKIINKKKIYSSYSSVLMAKPVLDKVKLNASNNLYQSIKLSWNKISGANDYIIYRSDSEKGNYKKIATVKTNKYKDKSAKQNKLYYYKVKPRKKVSKKMVNGSYSNIISGFREDNLFNVSLSNTNYNNIVINIKPLITAKKYEIYRRDSKKGRDKLISTINASNEVIKFTDSKLSYNHTYYYKIRAYNKDYTSYISKKYTTKLEAPTINVYGSNNKTFTVKYKTSKKAEKFETYLSINDLAFSKEKTTKDTFLLDNSNNENYKITIKARGYNKSFGSYGYYTFMTPKYTCPHSGYTLKNGECLIDLPARPICPDGYEELGSKCSISVENMSIPAEISCSKGRAIGDQCYYCNSGSLIGNKCSDGSIAHSFPASHTCGSGYYYHGNGYCWIILDEVTPTSYYCGGTGGIKKNYNTCTYTINATNYCTEGYTFNSELGICE